MGRHAPIIIEQVKYQETNTINLSPEQSATDFHANVEHKICIR